jgi:hypothetical protein
VCDGTKLEALAAGAICSASHMGGVAGIDLKQFLEQLAYELSIPRVGVIDTPRKLSFDSHPDFNVGGLCCPFLRRIRNGRYIFRTLLILISNPCNAR